MAIVKMKKFNLLILNAYRENLLRELQLFRNVQFEDAVDVEDFSQESLSRYKKPAIEEDLSYIDEVMNKCNYGIDLIGKYAPSLSGLKALIAGLPNYTFEEMEKRVSEIDFEGNYKEIKSLGDELALVESSISRKKDSIKELEPLINLDVSLDDLNKVEKFNVIVGGVSGKVVDNFKTAISELDFVYCEELGVYKDEQYFFIVNDKRDDEELNEVFRTSNFNRIKVDSSHTPKESISILEKEIEELDGKKNELIQVISSKTDMLEEFKLCHDYNSNIKVRSQSQKDFMSTDSVCLISGYCPEYEMSHLEKRVSGICGEDYTLEFFEVDKDSEDVPIMLKNNKIVKVFESITSTYALPRYNEIDPTPFYAPIYALFFGMMSADFGYGAILFLLTTIGLKVCNFSPDMKKNVKFFQLISISTTIWGFLYGSYFGASIPGMWRLFDLGTQFMTVLVISVIMGGIHLAYGLAIKAYMLLRDGKPVDMFFDVISWYVVLTGIIVLLLSVAGILSPALGTFGKYAMYIGIVLLIIGGARTAEGNIVTKFVAGIYNVYGISNYIGDFVSYSRLMALGMAGGYIAFSVNMIAGMAWGGIIGSIFAIIILVFFHAFNLFLSCLGAYVHALRLIYVEFFGKFYEGGGKAFRYFRGETKYINLDRHLEE